MIGGIGRGKNCGPEELSLTSSKVDLSYNYIAQGNTRDLSIDHRRSGRRSPRVDGEATINMTCGRWQGHMQAD
jgi:hypothetical protein